MRASLLLVLVGALFTAPACRDTGPESAPDVVPIERSESKVFSLPGPLAAHAATNETVTVADVTERVLPWVVSVSSTRAAQGRGSGAPFGESPLRRFFEFGPGAPAPPDRIERGLGSGVIVGNGIVVTNAHVVEKADEILVATSDGREFDARVVGADSKSDIAVIRLEGDTSDLKPAVFGDSARMRLGDLVLAVGNPFGVGQTVTMGIVSAKGRADLGIADYEDFIQTDAAINPGNSGGALVNMEGQVIGINTAILSRTGGYMGIGFAAPTNMVQPIIKSLLEEGRVVRGWMGVAVQTVDRDLAQAFDLETSAGVLIADVEPGGPADKAGLRPGDVVLSVDGKKTDSSGQLRNYIAASGGKGTVDLGILREGKRERVTVTVEEMPEGTADTPTDSPPGAEPDRQALAGLVIENVTPEIRKKLGVPPDVNGVVVVGLRPGSIAAQAGLQPGDVIREVNRKPVASIEDFRRLWTRSEGNVLLWIRRQGQSLYLVARR